jgi:hypothetical protein
MTGRRFKGKRQESLSKSEGKGKSMSTVAEEVNFGEAKKDLLESEFMLAEHKPVLHMHPRHAVRDENQSDSWYFTHT